MLSKSFTDLFIRKPVIALVNLSGIQDNRVPRRCTWTCGAIHLGAHFVP